MNIIRIVKDMMHLRVLFRNMTNPTVVKQIKNNKEKIIEIDDDGETESESECEPATKQRKQMMKKPAGKPQKFELDGSDSDMDEQAPSKTLSDEENDITRDRVTASWFHANEQQLSEDR